MIRTALLCAALLMPVVAAAQGDPVVDFGETDPVMNAAMQDAQTSLPLFVLNATDADGFGLPGTAVKVGMPTIGVGASVEHIWVNPFLDLGDGQFVGLLANKPNGMGDMDIGDEVRFDANMISDWSFATETAMFGNFTTRVMLPHMPEDAADRLRSQLSPDPVPAQWRN